MKKSVLALVSVFLLSLVITDNVFANKVKYVVSFQIINADTFQEIQKGSLEASRHDGYRMNDSDIKNNIRRQLGFPNNSDTRTAGGVNQRLIWVNINMVEDSR